MVKCFGPGEVRGGRRGVIHALLTTLPDVVNPDVSALISSEKRIFLLRGLSLYL